MSKLPVAEWFYSVQGEGPYAGKPAVFIRLAGCNLRCGAVDRDLDDVDPIEDEPTEGASWICDTIPEWKEADQLYTPEEMVESLRNRGVLEPLAKNKANIVLTGGEPTIPKSQNAFVDFCQEFKNETDSTPLVEVETNGTVAPMQTFHNYISQYNVSLKLSNSGHDKERRINEEAIEFHNDCRHSKYKFVVGKPEDVDEIEQLADEFNMADRDITLMPAGQTREQLNESYPEVVEICKERGYKFSPRLHVNIWNQQTGV